MQELKLQNNIVLGPYYFENLVKLFKSASLLLTKLYDCTAPKIIQSYLTLLEARDCSGDGIFPLLKDSSQ